MSPRGSVEVVRAGLATSVQDLGRPGLAEIGVTRSGAVDAGALAIANRLVGNPAGAPGFETCGGLALRATVAMLVAVSGAEVDAIGVDGASVSRHTPVSVPAGALLTVGAAVSGLRCYVAVRGGVRPEPVLGSCSWDSLGRIGPPPPQPGELLAIGADPRTTIAADTAPERPRRERVRLWPGPRLDWFDPDDVAAIVVVDWRVRPDSDRVGARLTGRALRRVVDAELPSEPLVPGAIQVPSGGLPIVMLADHPTTGGYPVIAVVDPDDLGIVAQSAPGSVLRFEWARRSPSRR